MEEFVLKKFKYIRTLGLFAFFTLSAFSISSYAQVQTATQEGRGHIEQTLQRNLTGSCDSTCDAMGPTAPALSMQAAFITRIQSCGAGYTGSKTQSRTQNPDGSFTPWVDSNTSQCVCSPTYADTTQTCSSPLSGTYVQRTNWTCSANVGSWGSPYTTTNNCFTPCVVPATQYTSSACPAGYTGAYYYQNPGTCPGGAGSNSTPGYSGWTMYSNTCVPRRYGANEFSGIYTPPASEGLTGFLSIYNGTGVTFTLDSNPLGGWGPYTIYDMTEGVTYAQFSYTSGYAPYGENRQTWAAGTWIGFPSGAAVIGRVTLPNGQVLSGNISTSFSHFTITP